MKQKEESKAYAQFWETNATPKTHDPIARVTGMLEQNKNTKETLLEGLHYSLSPITAGRAITGDKCRAKQRIVTEREY